MDRDLQLSNEIKRINEHLAVCHRVKDTLDSKGWVEIVEPLIEKTILDITGGKINGRWYGGLMDRARKDERREYYIGYKQALIDLHRRLMAYIDSIKVNEDKRDKMIADQTPRYTLPLVDDTRYGRKRNE